jgi:glycosyltransferase involved in cell wall biosynthesis
VMVGRLTDLKGAAYAIRAMPLAAQQLGFTLTLSILGTGPEEGRLKTLAQELGVAVQFHGWMDREPRNDVMRAADLLVVPSVWPEPFGMVGVEAARLGLPAVAYAVGGISEWLIPGTSGEMASGDPPTVEGLADAIVRALRDPDRLAALRRGSWEVARRFTIDAHLGRLDTLLSTVVASRA